MSFSIQSCCFHCASRSHIFDKHAKNVTNIEGRELRLNASNSDFLVSRKHIMCCCPFRLASRRGSSRCGIFPRLDFAPHKRGRRTPSRQPTPCLRRCRGIHLTQPSPTTWTTSMDFAQSRRFERNKVKPATHLGTLMCWSLPVHIPSRQRFAPFFCLVFAP